MQNKKIVFFINSLDGGGAERVVSTLLNNLVEKYECHLILMENKISYDLDSRVDIICLNESLKQNGIVKLLRLPVMAYKLNKIVKKYGFTKVLSFLHRANYVNILAKYFSNHKAIISERIASSSLYKDNSITSKISNILINKLYNKADLIISVSKAIVEDLKINYKIKSEQIVIYNPYDIEKIRKLSSENINVDIDKNKSIITVGSLSKRKNHQILINAFSKIEKKNDIKLYILGKGEEEDSLKNLVKELELEDKVIFLGFDNNPYKYLSKCGIFIMSSNSEGFPNVLVEAMICGCSVISTDCLSGPREILAPISDIKFQLSNEIEYAEYGLLTSINDQEKIKESLDLLLENNSLKIKYISKMDGRIKDFGIEKIVNEYELVLGKFQ